MAAGLKKTALLRKLAEKFKIGAKTGSTSKKPSGPRSHDGPRGVIAGKLGQRNRTWF